MLWAQVVNLWKWNKEYAIPFGIEVFVTRHSESYSSLHKYLFTFWRMTSKKQNAMLQRLANNASPNAVKCAGTYKHICVYLWALTETWTTCICACYAVLCCAMLCYAKACESINITSVAGMLNFNDAFASVSSVATHPHRHTVCSQ